MKSIPATLIRGGTSKGLFFNQAVLPAPGRRRDKLLLAAMGSPDPYGKQVDGLGGATSSTSKVVVVGPTREPGHDLQYLFGQVAVREPFVDWSGNCGNLTAAVASFALREGLVAAEGLVTPYPSSGTAQIRMFQQNIRKTIIAHVPLEDGVASESGSFQPAGVTFPGALTKIEFVDPADGPVFPTGNKRDTLETSWGSVEVTLVNVAMPMVLAESEDLSLEQLEELRALGALKMGLIRSLEDAKRRQHTPKIALIGAPKSYKAASGQTVDDSGIEFYARAVSMGQWHHAFMGTGAIAVACAAAFGALGQSSGEATSRVVKFGHPSGVVEVEIKLDGDRLESCTLARSSRVLMRGDVYLPEGAKI